LREEVVSCGTATSANTKADVTFLGNIVDCHVTLDDGTRVRVQVDSGEILELGQRVCVRFDSRQSSVFSA